MEKAKWTRKDIHGRPSFPLKVYEACVVWGLIPSNSRRAWGGFVALRSGVLGGSGTSQPNLIMAATKPPRTPTSAATPYLRCVGSV